MASICKSIFPIISCFNPKKPLETKVKSSNQRLCLSDVSYNNDGSPISLMSDLSNSLIGSNLQIFALQELKVITKNFSKSNCIGEGGFGPVYKGFIADNSWPGLKAQPVAVKVLNLDGSQGHREWLAEVIFLGQLKHPHLVNLIGYCCEDEHRLLVYEYMARGNLWDHLFKGYTATLPWLTRIKIVVGGARGLAFLHEEDKPVIYRDFKASNVLLDHDFNAKLSDFGFATDGPRGDETHITTCVMGTEGYAAPEYIKTGHLTAMSDVFSFGVVLLELITGRKAIDKSFHGRKKDLVDWARPFLKDQNKLHLIMDPRLEGQYSEKGAQKAAALAYQCLSHNPKSRPTMRRVVNTLEPLLSLTDIPIGPFVYVVSSESPGLGLQKNGKEWSNQCDIGKENKAEKNELNATENGRCRKQKQQDHRRRIKSLRSRSVHSGTALYKKLGSSLYSPIGLERDIR